MRREAERHEELYTALLRRDPAYEGFVFVGVTSTRIFCRLTCPARKPRPENTRFFDSVTACLAAGFRPCKRCRPLVDAGAPDPVVERLTRALEVDPDRRWSEADLLTMGLDPSTVRRSFNRRFGMTFLKMARLRRVGNAAGRLATGSRVIEAQVEAGFDSASGFRAAFARLLGAAPARLRGNTLLAADWIETPLGPMVAVADAQNLHLLEFLDRRALPTELQKLQRRTSPIALGRKPPTEQIRAELTAYFRGERPRFRTPLAQDGTPFFRDVWRLLREIPHGETRTYSEIATAVGKPSSVRAVARANGANQLAIVVPCHRVIARDGSLAGYGGGLWRKRWLLEHERRTADVSSPIR